MKSPLKFDKKRVWGPEPKYPTLLAIKEHDIKIKKPIIIAGPCSIENINIMRKIGSILKGKATYLRGGIYRAGTYPPDTDVRLLHDRVCRFIDTAKKYELKTVVEIINLRNLPFLSSRFDVIQVGARQMQNYGLLMELSKIPNTITIKRNMGATLDEFLGAVEYLVRNGKRNVIMIERGGSTYHSHVRWDLSISLIAAVKRITSLPIIVDASHGTGRRDLVESMTLAGIAAGADGFLIEVHPEPEKSLTDTDQAFPLDKFNGLLNKANKIMEVL